MEGVMVGRREVGKIVVVGGKTSVLGSVGSGHISKQSVKDRKQRKIHCPKKGFNDGVGKKQADRKLSLPLMAKIVCDRLPTFSSEYPFGKQQRFVIMHITDTIDTNNACRWSDEHT